jgi:hypothetical protein
MHKQDLNGEEVDNDVQIDDDGQIDDEGEDERPETSDELTDDDINAKLANDASHSLASQLDTIGNGSDIEVDDESDIDVDDKPMTRGRWKRKTKAEVKAAWDEKIQKEADEREAKRKEAQEKAKAKKKQREQKKKKKPFNEPSRRVSLYSAKDGSKEWPIILDLDGVVSDI